MEISLFKKRINLLYYDIYQRHWSDNSLTNLALEKRS